MTNKYTDTQIAAAYALYRAGAPADHIKAETGVSVKHMMTKPQCRSIDGKKRKALIRKWRETHTDWTPLEGIKPEKNPPRGYSTFTAEEGERIRRFYYANHLSMRQIGERLGVSGAVINIVINGSTRFVRRSKPTPEASARYQAAKSERSVRIGRPWMEAGK